MKGVYETPYDIKIMLKRILIYLLIAFPFVLAIATLLTILNAPLPIIILCNILVGGVVVLIEVVIHGKIKEKKKEKQKSKYDPFRD